MAQQEIAGSLACYRGTDERADSERGGGLGGYSFLLQDFVESLQQGMVKFEVTSMDIEDNSIVLLLHMYLVWSVPHSLTSHSTAF